MNRRSARLVLAWAGVLLASRSVAGAQVLRVQNWRDLSPKERYDAMQNYWQHEQLPQDRQQDIEKRYERWQGMSPDERARIRQNYQRFQQLQPAERERFQRKYDKWKQQGAPP
jgi:hypothetical protein